MDQEVEDAVRQPWGTFAQEPSQDVVACDFFVSVTATFQLL